jgi:hypothetical protein
LPWGTEKNKTHFGDTTGLFAPYDFALPIWQEVAKHFTQGIAEKWNLTSKILMPCAIT